MDSINPTIALCALLPIIYISAFVHELGHALTGHAIGFTVTSFGLGVGRPFAVFSRGGTRIYFCRTKPLQGITFGVPPRVFPPRPRMILYLAGGIIANGLLAVLALALYRWLPWGRNVWHPACFANTILAITNLMPFQFRIGNATLRTDGRLMLQILRDRVISTPAPQALQMLKTFRSSWRSIRDDTMLRLTILGAAAAYSEMDDFERGESVLSELDSVVPSNQVTVQAREALIRGSINCGTGRLDDAADALQSAETLFRTTGDDGGLFLTAMQRSWFRILRHDTAGALGELSALTSDRLVKQGSWFQGYFHAFCVQAHAAGSNRIGAEQSLKAYETTRRRHPSDWRDLRVYKAAARLRARDEDWVSAEAAYRRACEALNAIVRSWPDPEEQSHFLQRQSVFFDEARSCYRILNRADEAERLVTTVLSAGQIQQQLDDAERRRGRRLVHAGRWALLIDVFFTIGLIGLLAFLDLQPGHPIFAASTLFALLTFVALILFVPYFMIGWIMPRLRDRGARVMLVMACFPWLAMLIFLVTSMF